MKWLRILAWFWGVLFIVAGLYWLPLVVTIIRLCAYDLGYSSSDPYLDEYRKSFISTPFGYFEARMGILIYGGLSLVPLLGGVMMVVWAWRNGRPKPSRAQSAAP